MEAEKELADRDVVVVAVSVLPKESRERVERVVRESRAEALLVGYADKDTKEAMYEIDPDKGSGLPYTVFIDADGKARAVHRGGSKKADFVKAIGTFRD